MPKTDVLTRYKDWRQAKKIEAEERARERVKLLPADLQEEILEACDREREQLQARIEEIDAELEKLEAVLTEARQNERQARINTTGTGRGQQGAAAIEAGKVVRRVAAHIYAFQEEKRGRRRQLREVRRVKESAEAGLVTGILAITRNWQNQIVIGDLAPRAKGYVDAAGYELPPEALDAEGKPLPTPEMPERS